MTPAAGLHQCQRTAPGRRGSDTAATVILDGDSGRFGGTAAFADGGKSVHFTGSAEDGETVTIDVTC